MYRSVYESLLLRFVCSFPNDPDLGEVAHQGYHGGWCNQWVAVMFFICPTNNDTNSIIMIIM